MLIDGFFALVNFYPVAPHRARGPRRYVYAEMEASQAEWFQHNVLDEFNDENNTNLQLRVVQNEAMLHALADARGHGNDAVLAAVPIEFALRAIHDHAARPFDEAVPSARIASDLADVRPEAITGARAEGRQWFLPRSTVLDVAVYRASRVRDAEEHWTLVRPQIEAALRAVNGRGLPAGYQLDQWPPDWDQYDLFVLGYYWAHRSYDGQPARPRIAHRSGDDVDAQLDIVSGIYRMGGSDATIPHADSTASVDYFAWETLYRQQGLYAPEMFDDDGLDDEGMLDAIGSGDIYLANIDQVEAFSLHGGGHRGVAARVREPEDIGFVAMPRGMSLDLDARGRPARHASGFSFREETVWMLPSGGPDTGLAYALVRWALARENHVRECEALGLLPIREDVIRERASIFRLQWMSDVFDSAFAQWPRSEPVPGALLTNVGPTYAALWSHLVNDRAVAPTPRDAIATALRAPPPPAAPSAPATPTPTPTPPAAASADAGAQNEDLESIEAEDPGAWRQRVVLQWADAGAQDASDAAAE
jgi:hypothetical protein